MVCPCTLILKKLHFVLMFDGFSLKFMSLLNFIQIANIFSQRFQNSFAEIARLLSEFFRDLDVVPTDVLVRPTSTFFLLTNLFILHYHPSKIIASLPHNI